ncbi:MAG: hypothetical protein LBU68_02610 [Rickettsiales bacterium]|jgi:hypothetical protein|nr:hypothetical protein [Rickettsiales bacterium]
MLKKIFSFTFFAIGLVILLCIFMPEAFAQMAQIGETDTVSSFDRLVGTLKTLFYSGRNLVFILSGFSLLWAAYTWIQKPGDFDWKNVIWFLIALVILATIGIIIDAAVFGVADMAGFREVTPTGSIEMSVPNGFDGLRNQMFLENTGNWSNY